MSSRLAFQTQLASIMEVLANAAVAEICKLVDDDYAVVSLQMSQCQRENKALKRKLHLLELKMARGNAERRLRESAMNSCRPRGHLHPGDKPRESSPCIGGMFSQHMDVALWSGRAAARDVTSEPVLSERIQSKSPDVQLVESEPVLVKEEKMETNMSQELEEGVALMGDGGVLEHAPHGAASQRPSLELQDTQSTSSQSQNQIQSGRARFTTSSNNNNSSSSNNSRGVEKDEEPDVVLVKVEEANLAAETPNQTGLSIQEGLVESSTDDYRGVLPFDETAHTTSSQMSDLQDSRRGFSEVSNGDTSLWTNRGGIYGDSLPGPSSHYAPPSYLPSSHAGAEPGSSGKGLCVENSVKRGSSVESSRGLPSFSFEQQHPIIDLSEEASPSQTSGQMHVGQMSVDAQKIPMRRVYLCSFCGKGFRSPANLESHLRTHTGERPYGCVICGKKFSQFWNLKIHKNIHTGERPYQCTLCPERFSDPSNLKKHQKRHHPQDTGMHSGTS